MVTLTCVSNPVGGDLISNAVWTGYRVRDLLAAAGVHPDADMVLSTSIDGFTAGTPVEALTDGRDALLAITMNGQPLPIEHGYPGAVGGSRALRLRLGDEVDRRPPGDPVRSRRGLLDGPRLGTPAAHQDRVTRRRPAQRPGRAARSGEVRRRGLGAAPRCARRRGPASTTALGSLRNWVRATPTTLGGCGASTGRPSNAGQHRIAVRATDNTGATQTSDQAEVMPDGATGWHSVSFAVA